MKTLEQIKDEYAGEQGRDSWQEFFTYCELCHVSLARMQYHHDQIATRYAQQFKNPTDTVVTEISVMKKRIAELEELLEGIAKAIEKGERIGKINLLTINSVEYDSIKRLINKGTK